jgi:hypothetical protein
MANQYHRPPLDDTTSPVRTGRSPVSLRMMAILVMLIGAGGFVFSLIVYGEQVLCLLGSTVVTFIGLGLTIAARRYSSAQQDNIAAREYVQQDASERQTHSERHRQSEGQSPQSENWSEGLGVVPGALSSLAVEAFRQDGARVAVEAQRETRCILHIRSKDEENFVAIVLEDDVLIDTPDVRALYALMTSTGSQGGYLITQGRYTQRASEWAKSRGIFLVDKQWLEQLRS